MASYYLTASRPNGATLYLSPLTERQVAASDLSGTDTSGHFLYERTGIGRDSVRVLAQVFSDDGVEELRSLLNLV